MRRLCGVFHAVKARRKYKSAAKTADLMAELTVSLLGPPRFERDGQLVPELTSAKAQALLAFLLVSGKPISRPALATLLWGEMPEKSARGNLRQALTRLRKATDQALRVDGQWVSLRAGNGLSVDCDAFARTLADAAAATDAALKDALKLYRGEFLADFQIQEAPEFDAWTATERERFRRMALVAWQILAERARDRPDAGIEALQGALLVEPWNEEAHRELMQLYAMTGQRSAALAQFETLARKLGEHIGVRPSAESLAAYEVIRQGAAPITAERPAAEPRAYERGELQGAPVEFAPLVGREASSEAIRALIAEPGCRLLTLTGEGGIGKTRLAAAAAQSIASTFRDGAWFVALAGIPPGSRPIASLLSRRRLATRSNSTPARHNRSPNS
jgi:DNA-binding SARP family transcriptional activator